MVNTTGAGSCGVDSGEENSGPRVDIVTSTYTD